MTDVEWIFVVLGILYLIESLCWVRTGTIAFPRRFGRNHSPQSTLQLLGNERGQLILNGILPADASFLAPPVPISIGASGVSTFVRAAPLLRERPAAEIVFANWEQIGRLTTDQSSIMLGGKPFCHCQSPYVARAIADALLRMAQMETSDRAAEIERFTDCGFDPSAARQRIDEWFASTARLRLAALMLFIIVFPIGLARYAGVWVGVKNNDSLLWYLGTVLVIWWWAALLGFLSHRRLYPDRVGSRIKLLFTSLVSPVVPMRAPATLAKDLFDHVHPLTLATAMHADVSAEADHFDSDSEEDEEAADTVSDPAEEQDVGADAAYSFNASNPMLQSIAGEAVRDIVFPSLPAQPVDVAAEHASVIDEHHDRITERIETLSDQMGLEFESMFAAPGATDPMSQSYCPRCQQEYTVKTANCIPCGGRETRPMS